MYRSVRVRNYRGFSRYEMRDLGRVNLLVGKNNSGKTSVLEALYVLGSGGDPAALWRICNRRGERFVDDGRLRGRSEADISHLFSGHELLVGQSFSVDGVNSVAEQGVTVSVEDRPERGRDDDADLLRDEEASPPRLMSLKIRSSALRRQQEVPLSRQGGLEQDLAEFASRRAGRPNRESAANVHFISTESFTGTELIRHWDRIQLTSDETLVVQALRFVDKSIEHVRSFGIGSVHGPRGGFIVKRHGDLLPVPLGSLGDGAWRMLTLAIVLTQSAGGMLFIDEVDTGLHHTVMADMWRLIYAAAKQFDVQVFASTHSYDCVHSLSTICPAGDSAGEEVTIQRIEANKSMATPFSEAEIQVAAERNIEIR
jgi:hypothetical protein